MSIGDRISYKANDFVLLISHQGKSRENELMTLLFFFV
jgi:hypothetical protein